MITLQFNHIASLAGIAKLAIDKGLQYELTLYVDGSEGVKLFGVDIATARSAVAIFEEITSVQSIY